MRSPRNDFRATVPGTITWPSAAAPGARSARLSGRMQSRTCAPPVSETSAGTRTGAFVAPTDTIDRHPAPPLAHGRGDQVPRADEVREERSAGVVVDLPRRAGLLDLAGVHYR